MASTSSQSAPAGALRKPSTQDLEAGGRGKSALKPHTPVFMENPDGTIIEAVPSTYKPPKPRASRTQIIDDVDSDNSEVMAANLFNDVDFLYSQHTCVLMVLLSAHFAATGLYNFVYVVHMQNGSSVREFMEMYAWDNRLFAERVLWTCYGVQLAFSASFYAIAATAVWTQRPSWYRLLANFGIGGILGFVLLAYVDKFNLVVFFLHLLTYIYAKFLQGLTSSLMLLPPPRQRNQGQAQGTAGEAATD